MAEDFCTVACAAVFCHRVAVLHDSCLLTTCDVGCMYVMVCNGMLLAILIPSFQSKFPL